MTSEIKASCAEFAKNPVAGGVKWHAQPNMWGSFYCDIGEEFRIEIDYVPDYGSFIRICTPFRHAAKVEASSMRECAEAAISLCRDRVEKMYQGFKQLETPKNLPLAKRQVNMCNHTGDRFNPRLGEVVCSQCLERLE